MKRRIVKSVLCVLIAVCLLTAAGCAADPFAATNKLVLYGAPLNGSYAVQAAIAEYKRTYPEVEVEYIPYEGGWGDEEAAAAFNQRLRIELMAGKGPDVVLFDYNTFDDLYKVLESSVFTDINPYMERDEAFDPDDYLTAVLDGGVYKGERLYVPLTYSAEYLRAESSQLAALGIELSEPPTFAEWSAEMQAFLASRSHDEIAPLLEDWFRSDIVFYAFSGLQVIDYEAGTVTIDDDELRAFADVYKALLAYERNPEWSGYDLGCRAGDFVEYDTAVVQGAQLFESRGTHVDYGDWMTSYYEKLGWEAPDRMFAFPTMQGDRAIAFATTSAAINKGSPNKQNAYNFIALALEIEAKYACVGGSSMMDSVNKLGLQRLPAGAVDALDGETVEGYENVLPLEYCDNYSNAVMDMVYNALTPYFEDEKPFEDCVAELRNTLELYLYE